MERVESIAWDVGRMAKLVHGLSTQTRQGRILVCTHSNAAVDELLGRLLQERPAFVDEFGRKYFPDVVRLGRHSSDAVAVCSLDKRSESFFDRITALLRAGKTAAQEAEYSKMTQEISHLEGKMITLNEEVVRLAVNQRGLECLPANSNHGPYGGLSADKRMRLEKVLLESSQIIFCTMNAASDKRLEQILDGFETIIFDEAAQAGSRPQPLPREPRLPKLSQYACAGELSTLIPLRYCKKLAVLRLGLGRSLFERLQSCKHPCRMLKTQYRMHPCIRSFPSRHFYKAMLRDGFSVVKAVRARAPPIGRA
ncbi:MAG: hypothetical protein SGPRY_006298 [Prymnesium sp.]